MSALTQSPQLGEEPRAGRGGRPRDASRADVIREAALDLLAEQGYERVTMDAVAARAGVGKATVYRRWTSKADLLVDALDGLRPDGSPADQGSLRDDLECLCAQFVHHAGGRSLAVMQGLASALAREPGLLAAVHEHFVAPRKQATVEVLARAVERGEMPPGKDSELLASVIPALMIYRILTSGEPPDPGFARRLIDEVLVPAATAGTNAPDEGPRAERNEEQRENQEITETMMTTTFSAGRPEAASPSLMRLMLGFMASRVAITVLHLGIDEALAAGPRPAPDLAAAAGASVDGVERLLRAGVGLGLFRHREPDCFELTELGTELHAQRDQMEFLNSSAAYLLTSHLSEAVISGRSVSEEVLGSTLWGYLASRPEEQAAFDRGMAGITRATMDAVVQNYDLAGFHRIVDVGGGHGAGLAALLRAAPQASGILFDQPHVIAQAGDLFRAEDLTTRVELLGGSFLESVPPDGDLYFIKTVIFNWDDHGAAQILRNCAQAAPPGATLLIVEPVRSDHPAPSFEPIIDLLMLTLANGRSRTVEQHRTLLHSAGWRLDAVRELPALPGQAPLAQMPLALLESHRQA